MALYGKRRQTEVLEVLTCTKKSEIVKDYFVMLSKSVEGVDTEKALVRWSQHSHIFDILISKYAQNNEIREYILQNFEKVKPRSYSRTMVIKEIISNIYSKKQLNETYNFLKKDGKVRTEDLTTMINTRLTQLQDMKSSFVYNFS
ncbi:hypothetical protein DMN91_005263 [Ooceraea biroi]|uniref:Uncharacterized protein n=2 Tax=Ooceraea biroi TaxID=2015173 RepID=A0A3L8DRC0_OOCBI|nr:hypothetical protein DMN91_005263 [Ooceraea biroi]